MHSLKKTTENKTSLNWNFNNSYTQLPSSFFSRQNPIAVKAPHLVIANDALAHFLGLSDDKHVVEGDSIIFSGNKIPEGADPIAQAYAGHQFGHFNILGDGRAILLGEHITPSGARYDIQLKGSGETAYSRSGDGRAALGPMLREYIISEAMHALGVPTTRSLAVVSTGEPVYRNSVLPGAILTRVASSHIRVGTFQFARTVNDEGAIRALANYTLSRHFPEYQARDNKYLSLLEAVIDRQAALLAKWMQVGFIHGVMNTDNMSICGETIDYGPCAFMDIYDPATVFSSIDQHGRYAFGNQPAIAHWNLTRFAETLLPLLDSLQEESIKMAENALETFSVRYKEYWHSGMRAKLGIFNEEPSDDLLIENLLVCMKKNSLDYTNTFRDLGSESSIKKPMLDLPEFMAWHALWKKRLEGQDQTLGHAVSLMLETNPAVIPRNYQVEAALSAAELGDFSLAKKLVEVLSDPFTDNEKLSLYREPPPPSTRPYKTYCGT